MEIKAMTFNLRVLNAKDGFNAWNYRVEQVAEMIRQSGASIVGTQEVLPSMMSDLERQLPEFGWIACGRNADLQGEQSAILYRKEDWEVLESGTFWLSGNPSVPGSIGWDASLPRICTWGVLRSAADPGYSFILYNTHFDHVGEEARQQSAVVILKAIREKRPELPAILMGDLNARPDSRTIALLSGEVEADGGKSHLADTFHALPAGTPRATFHGFTGKTEGSAIIDYIFTTPQIVCLETVIDQRKIDGRYPSDHFPVMSRLVLPPV